MESEKCKYHEQMAVDTAVTKQTVQRIDAKLDASIEKWDTHLTDSIPVRTTVNNLVKALWIVFAAIVGVLIKLFFVAA